MRETGKTVLWGIVRLNLDADVITIVTCDTKRYNT